MVVAFVAVRFADHWAFPAFAESTKRTQEWQQIVFHLGSYLLSILLFFIFAPASHLLLLVWGLWLGIFSWRLCDSVNIVRVLTGAFGLLFFAFIDHFIWRLGWYFDFVFAIRSFERLVTCLSGKSEGGGIFRRSYFVNLFIVDFGKAPRRLLNFLQPFIHHLFVLLVKLPLVADLLKEGFKLFLVLGIKVGHGHFRLDKSVDYFICLDHKASLFFDILA